MATTQQATISPRRPLSQEDRIVLDLASEHADWLRQISATIRRPEASVAAASPAVEPVPSACNAAAVVSVAPVPGEDVPPSPVAELLKRVLPAALPPQPQPRKNAARPAQPRRTIVLGPRIRWLIQCVVVLLSAGASAAMWLFLQRWL